MGGPCQKTRYGERVLSLKSTLVWLKGGVKSSAGGGITASRNYPGISDSRKGVLEKIYSRMMKDEGRCGT